MNLSKPKQIPDAKESRACGWMLGSFPVVTPATRVATALRLLREHEIPAVPVCDDGQLRGLVDEKALLRYTPSELTRPTFRELPDLHVTVAECIPEGPVTTVRPETPMLEVAALMARDAVDTLPVAREGCPVGLITWPFVLGAALLGSPACAPTRPGQAPRRSVSTGAEDPVGLHMCPVRDWMVGSFPVISRRTTVATAIHLLRTYRIPALPVCERLSVLGFVDEKALLRLTPSAATTHSISEIRYLLDSVRIGGMYASPAAAANPGTPLDEAAALMVMESAEVVPVLDNGRLIGMLPWDRVLAAAAGEPPEQIAHERQRWLFWM